MDILTALFIANTTRFNLPNGLLSSLCFVESRHISSIVHKHDGKSHSYGICQVKLETARYLGFIGTQDELLKPENNIFYAAMYLNKQIRRYNDITKGIVAYNRGNALRLTRSNYSDKVIKHWGENNKYVRN